MNTVLIKFASTGFFFLAIFLSGFWLSHSGKPYSALFFNFHKLITLGAVAFLGVTVYKLHQAAPLSPLQTAAVIISALFFITTIIMGGLLSIATPVPAVIHKMHQITPYLTVLSTAVTLYVLMAGTRDLFRVF